MSGWVVQKNFQEKVDIWAKEKMLRENIPGKGRDGENLKAGPETKK